MTVDSSSIVYAALILSDDGADISVEKLKSLTEAANVKVEPYWYEFYADFFKTNNVSDLIKNLSVGGGGGAAGPVADSAAGGAAPAAAKEEEKKEEESVALDLGDMFGDF